jgi:ABC-type antimicrobial peptide transport system permease subunit
MTLGARPAGVLRQVMAEALAQAGTGLLAGLLAAFATMRGLQALLFEVTPADPATFIVTTAAVLAVAGVAAIVPAVRAMRVNPVDALRAE